MVDVIDDIGPGRPPKKHQFKKGQSGNPKGRPKGSEGLRTILARSLSRRLNGTDSKGRRRSVTALEHVVNTSLKKALEGDARAVQHLLGLWIQAFGMEDRREGAQRLSNSDALALKLFLDGDAKMPAADRMESEIPACSAEEIADGDGDADNHDVSHRPDSPPDNGINSDTNNEDGGGS